MMEGVSFCQWVRGNKTYLIPLFYSHKPSYYLAWKRNLESRKKNTNLDIMEDVSFCQWVRGNIIHLIPLFYSREPSYASSWKTNLKSRMKKSDMMEGVSLYQWVRGNIIHLIPLFYSRQPSYSKSYLSDEANGVSHSASHHLSSPSFSTLRYTSDTAPPPPGPHFHSAFTYTCALI